MNRLLFVALLSLSSLSAGLTGCSGDASSADNGAGDEDELRALTLTEKDDGRTVTIAAGQSIAVKLGSNPTTGFDWEVTSTDRTFGYPKESFSTSSSAVGSGGTKKMTWSTRSPLDMKGTHKVTLEYKRSWENKPAAETFHFTVVVK